MGSCWHRSYRREIRVAYTLITVFLVVPVVEIWLLITVGSAIGAGLTILLVVLTAVIGAALVRAQGIATLTRAQAMINHGELPAIELLEGVALLLAGALLLTPGFFTDAVGFALLLPRLRRDLITAVLRRSFIGRGRRPGAAAPCGEPRRPLEGKYRRTDD
jgi:UPF0716 protein FxsA